MDAHDGRGAAFGSSALVSVPLMLLSAYANRFSAARLPLVMLLTYRVLQIVAGLIHLDRFDFAKPVTWNYFGGGGIVLVLIAVALQRGSRLGTPADDGPAWLGGQAPLQLGRPLALGLQLTAVLFWVLAAVFLVLGAGAGFMWFEQPGSLTPLTARLFASPALGLGIAAWVIARGVRRREAVIPAIGMATFGLTGLAALALSWPDVQPPTLFGYIVPLTPLVLLALGVGILTSGRKP